MSLSRFHRIDASVVTDHLSVGRWAWLAAAAALAAAAQWAATANFGAGTSPDSAAYVSAARSLLADGALVRFDGMPLADQPPLYPMLLAAVAGVAGIDVLSAARVLQVGLAALLAALLVYLVARFVTRSAGLLALTGLVAVLGAPLVHVGLMVWTESLFVALSIAALLCGLALAHRPDATGWLVALGCAAGASAVTRYAGLYLVAWAVLAAVLTHVGDLRAGLRRVAVVAGIALVPLAAWATRNAAHGMPPLGPRAPADATLREGARAIRWTLTEWATPHVIDARFMLLAVALAAACMVSWVLHERRSSADVPRLTGVQWLLLASLPVGYILFMLALSLRAAFDPLSNRLLVPAFLPLWITIVAVAAAALRRARSVRLARLAAAVACVVVASSIATAAAIDGTKALVLARVEGLGFSSVSWRASPLAQMAAGLPYRCALRSNNPAALYLLTGRPSKSVPARSPWRSSVRLDEIRYWPPSEPTCVVWFSTVARGDLYDLDEIRAKARAVDLVRTADGVILGVPADSFAGAHSNRPERQP